MATKKAKPAAKKTPAKKPVAKKAAKKAVVGKAAVKKAAIKKASAKKTPAKKAPAKKAAPAKKPAAKAPAKKAPAKKPPVKVAPAKKVVAKKPEPKKAPSTKPAVAQAPAKKVAPPAPTPPVVEVPTIPEPPKVELKLPPLKKGKMAEPSRLAVRDDESPWTKAELGAVRKELVDEEQRLRLEHERAEVALADLIRDGGDGAGDDQADAGAKTFEREHEMSLANNTADALEQVERALARIDDGSYGVCESCGSAIGKHRLQAFPRATLCRACKEKEERR